MRAGRLDAHPLHSSYAQITREQTGAVVIQVRLFTDDFGALLDSLRSASGAQSREDVARQYVRRQLVLTGADRAVIPIVWCGMRSDQNVVWICVRTTKPVNGAFRVRNALMFDQFADQISIIRWSGRKETRTLVLSARVPDALLN
jgi:hypothetical protein